MDSSHVASVSLLLRSEGFEHYRCDRNLSMGMNMGNMAKVLKCARKDDIVAIKAEDGGDSLNFMFESPNIDSEHLGIPEAEYEAVVRMSSNDLPFEFRALELALEFTCLTLDTLVKELEMEIHSVLDELAKSISTLNLERVRRFKGHLLALTQRVQKVCNEIEQLMNDDGDMAEMYLTEKKQTNSCNDLYDLVQGSNLIGSGAGIVSKSAPVSPMRSSSGTQNLHRAFSNAWETFIHK